jgi:demethylmenaquinone methyltransferase/2-methoxy-6-polyprenyl-1,4-benzoquinol methylase
MLYGAAMIKDSPAPSSEAPETTHFGFRTVRREDKAGLVRGVFENVAGKYDLMNDLMSAGVHRLWKAAMVGMLSPRPHQAIIDVAGGTGDIAFRILDRLDRGAKTPPDPPITVCDINPRMLAVGRDRALDRGRLAGLSWICADAEALPFPDTAFDAYTIAFGLRNVTDLDRALTEVRRVLKPGGQFYCLEFSRFALTPLAPLYDAYSFHVLPRIGQIVAGDREAYAYLVESIRRFPDQAALCRRMETAGLGQVKFRNLTGGIAAIHSGWRL